MIKNCNYIVTIILFGILNLVLGCKKETPKPQNKTPIIVKDTIPLINNDTALFNIVLEKEITIDAVSYTHLTLPTNREV